jgi:2-C-methyl-D-erythritol 2,4-cyclodiphosphate synthase
MKQRGYLLNNVDAAISLERPRIRPHVDEMRENLAAALEVDVNQISVKAKTGEKVDAVGESRAVRAEAVVLLAKA